MKQKKAFFIVFFILNFAFGFSQNKYISQNAKNKFNLKEIKNNGEQGDKSSKGMYDWLSGSDTIWQYTLINGSYFTIGTSDGLTTGIFDDDCSLTFGHPFAMSSYTFPIINGYEYSPLELMINQTGTLEKIGGTLIYTVELGGVCKAKFSMSNLTSKRIRLSYTLENISSINQSFGMGMVYDAANGKGDDGNVIYDNSFVTNYTDLSTSIQDSLVFWERNTNPKGVGYCMHFKNNKPDELTIANWQNLYYNDVIIDDLFDLALKEKWNEVNVSAGESVSFSVEIELLNPDYLGQPFVRWDMPSALSVENQILFPMDIKTTAQIFSNNQQYSNLELYTPENYNITEETSSPFSIITNDSIVFKEFNIELSEIYDSIVSQVSLKLMQGETVIDELVQNVFIPASPFSYEGLEVDADSVFVDDDKIIIRFNTKRESTGSYIYDLKRPNVFFYENSSSIENFELSKDTTGGTNNADIIFVLDVTGSMSDEISDVKNNIREFADSLEMNNINYQLGMVTFLDNIENIYSFTNDIDLFYSYTSEQYAHGGGDYPENSLDALMTAAQFDFRPNSTRTIIWITDASYHINDGITSLTKNDVIDALLLQGITAHCVGNPNERVQYYDQIVMNTGGNFYDINGNFRDVLMAVVRTDANPNYLLSYVPQEAITTQTTFNVENHYEGLGGDDDIIYNPTKELSDQNSKIEVFPNPTSNKKTIITINDNNAETCNVQIFDISGKPLFNKTERVINGEIAIDISNFTKKQNLISPSSFIVKLTVFDVNKNSYLKSFKLISN